MKSLLKENLNLWELDVSPEGDILNIIENVEFQNDFEEIDLDDDSKEVATYIAGYITKKLLKKSTCELCRKTLSDDQVSVGIEYTNLLSRGGLRLPTNSLATDVCRSFAKLDIAKKRLLLQPTHVRKAAEMVLRRDIGIQKCMCEEHFHWGMAAVNKTVTNIYFNNKQAIFQ